MKLTNLLLPFVLLLVFTTSNAQVPSKLNLSLHEKATDASRQARLVPIFVKGDVALIKDAAIKIGGTFKYSYGDIAALEVPANRMMDFAASKGIKHIKDGERRVHALNDSSVIHNNILPIHNGDTPLTMPYTGAGVIIGVIDDGIDFTHEDFIKANGDTRIRYLWDQEKSQGAKPIPYNYGTEWTSAQIDNGECLHVEQGGHGTNVTGVAAGNGRATGKFKGMAPQAELIIVDINGSAPFESSVVDAVDYIFKRADAMGRPCVVNLSYGTYYGSRDGKELSAQMIDAMLEERPGRAVIAAAGNAGNINYHLGYELSSDTLFSWFSPNSNKVYMSFWADTADFKNGYFAIGADDPVNGYAFLGRTQFFNLVDDYGLVVNNTGAFLDRQLNDSSGSFIGSIQTYAELVDGVFFWEALISPNTSDYLWRFMTTGEGRFDTWGHPSVINGSSAIVQSIPTASVMPDIIYYVLPDNSKTTVSSYTCSDKVITVGNYVNRRYYTDVNGNTADMTEPHGIIASTSSLGPTRDNRQKPDITATGNGTVTTGNQGYIASLISSGQAFKVAEGGKHHRNGGTSMAAPVVAGFAALYFQKNPNHTYQHLKDAITLTAKQDSFTGQALPDNVWGYGKLNAFEAIQMDIVYGCMDSTALNYNPVANLDDGSCIAIVMGCTDSVATNFNPTANMDDGSCLYDTVSVVENLNNGIYLKAYPNPFRDMVTFDYRMPNEHSTGVIRLYDLIGTEISSITLTQSTGKITYRNGDLTKGVYFYTVFYGDQTYSGKVAVY